jgi:hypothetical protein
VNQKYKVTIALGYQLGLLHPELDRFMGIHLQHVEDYIVLKQGQRKLDNSIKLEPLSGLNTEMRSKM